MHEAVLICTADADEKKKKKETKTKTKSVFLQILVGQFYK